MSEHKMSTKMLLPSIKEAFAHKVEKELLVAQFYPPRLLNATFQDKTTHCTSFLVLPAQPSGTKKWGTERLTNRMVKNTTAKQFSQKIILPDKI